MRAATLRMRSREPTEVPPYFWTMRAMLREIEGLWEQNLGRLTSVETGKNFSRGGYFSDFGSRASRSPSPRKLREKRVMEKMRAGKRREEGLENMALAPSLMRTPQELLGSLTPRPRKERVASKSMMLGMVRVV